MFFSRFNSISSNEARLNRGMSVVETSPHSQESRRKLMKNFRHVSMDEPTRHTSNMAKFNSVFEDQYLQNQIRVFFK